MHDGSLVLEDGYCGAWMTRIIRGLNGHHEPQEERIFDHLLQRCRPGTMILEIGAFWAYYTNWYLGAAPGATALCVEPDANNLACGQRNLAVNGRSATWIHAAARSAMEARRSSVLEGHVLADLIQIAAEVSSAQPNTRRKGLLSQRTPMSTRLWRLARRWASRLDPRARR